MDIFTPAQDEVYDIFTEVAAFVKWVNATALDMGGLHACKFCRNDRLADQYPC